MKAGYYVIPRERGRLRDGTSEYTAAVCVSVEPFILVSLDTTMLWSKVEPHEVIPVGPAAFETVENCRHRAIRDGLLPADIPVPEKRDLQKDLAQVLNCHNIEARSNTPDFVLAGYLVGCLEALAPAINARECWYGRSAPKWSKDEIESVEVVTQTPPLDVSPSLIRIPPLSATDPEVFKSTEKLAVMLMHHLRLHLSLDAFHQTNLVYAVGSNGVVYVLRSRTDEPGYISSGELQNYRNAALFGVPPHEMALRVVEVRVNADL